MQVMYLGRAPRTKETLPDFREKCRVIRHSRVFCGLTGSQRTPRDRGVTAWYIYIEKKNLMQEPFLGYCPNYSEKKKFVLQGGNCIVT